VTDEPGAIFIPTQNHFSGRQGQRPRYIIVHGTAGGSQAEAIARYFQSTENTSNPVSSHYVIGQDGTIVQCVREADGAWGNGVVTAGHAPWWSSDLNPNYISISVEHCKSSISNSEQLTEAQKEASFRLIEHICKRYDIPMREADAKGGITGHFSIDPVNRARCPGPYPWDELFATLAQHHTVS